MQPVMNVSDVHEFEASLAEKGLKTAELMRRAGAVVALQAARFVEAGSVVVMCGMGNNGGDGWVAADSLARHGYEVCVVSAATPAVIKGEAARKAASRAQEMGIPVHVDPSFEELVGLLADADVVVDAVFGTGFHGALTTPYDRWVHAVDEAFTGALVSVDVPSGIDASTGMAEGAYFDADVTVTMFAMKPGLVSGVGRAACGAVVVASLASDDKGLADLSDAAAAFALDEADYAGVLPEMDPLQDKYTRGRVLVVAGSARYPGAAALCALAAARSGAGYVTLAVPEPVVPVLQMQLPSIPVVGLPSDEEGSFAAEAADRIGVLAGRCDVVVAGPGLTTSFGACEVVRSLLAQPCALVLDADALNALVKICLGSAGEHPDMLRREHPLVLTPHRRELARLVGAEPADTASLAGAMRVAQSLAWSVGSGDFCVVAKGAVSAVATVDGTVIPEPGPAALATAGTGDVLAGIVASLLAQVRALDLEGAGVGSSELLMLIAAADRVHALAGFLAAEDHGSRGVIASDVAEKAGLAVDLLVERSERAAENAGEDAGSRLEGDLAFEDESRITPPPEVERLIRADVAAARAAQLPGELQGYGGDLEEPDGPALPGESVRPARPRARLADPAAPSEGGNGLQAADGRPDVPAEGAGARGLGGAAVVQPPATAQGPAGKEVAPASGMPPFLSGLARGGDAADRPADARGTAAPEEPEEGSEPAAGPAPADGEDAAGSKKSADGSAPMAEGAAQAAGPAEPQPCAGETPAPSGDAAPQTGADGSAMPPFLARAATAARPASETAVMRPVAADGGEGADRAEDEALFERAQRKPTAAELERRRIEAFHERATLHIDDDAVTPVDKRPSAKPRRKR